MTVNQLKAVNVDVPVTFGCDLVHKNTLNALTKIQASLSRDNLASIELRDDLRSECDLSF